MKLKDLTRQFETVLPLTLQEKWDHCGLNLGDPEQNITGVMFAYDVCLEVIAAAKKKKCNLIVSHHPFRMRAEVSLNLSTYENRIIAACIKNDIALYSAHTNHDVSAHNLNQMYLKKIGCEKIRPLTHATAELFKLIIFVPQKNSGAVLEALFAAGAGGIGHYSECSFRTSGVGTFRGDETTNPTVGEKNRRESVDENRIEVLVPQEHLKSVLHAMKTAHPYEEVAYDILKLENKRTDLGLGAIGELKTPMVESVLLPKLKLLFQTPMIRFVSRRKKQFKKIGICTGSGTSLLPQAIKSGCDLFITGDIKYHQAIDAKRSDLALADVGHFYSEVAAVGFLRNLFAPIFETELSLCVYEKLTDAFVFV